MTRLTPTAVYMMRDGSSGHYKFGISDDPGERLATFQTGNPDIEMITKSRVLPRFVAQDWEQELHKTLEPLSVGGEWFVLNDGNAATMSKLVRSLHKLGFPHQTFTLIKETK